MTTNENAENLTPETDQPNLEPQQPIVDEPAAPKGNNKWMLWVLLALLVIGGTVFAFNYKKTAAKNQARTEAVADSTRQAAARHDSIQQAKINQLKSALATANGNLANCQNSLASKMTSKPR